MNFYCIIGGIYEMVCSWQHHVIFVNRFDAIKSETIRFLNQLKTNRFIRLTIQYFIGLFLSLE